MAQRIVLACVTLIMGNLSCATQLSQLQETGGASREPVLGMAQKIDQKLEQYIREFLVKQPDQSLQSIFADCDNSQTFNREIHAYGIVTNATPYTVIATLPYTGTCYQVVIPAGAQGYFFGLLPLHWYGMEFQVAGRPDLTYKGARGLNGMGLAPVARRAYGGDLTIQRVGPTQAERLVLQNAQGLDPVPLTGPTSDCFKKAVATVNAVDSLLKTVAHRQPV